MELTQANFAPPAPPLNVFAFTPASQVDFLSAPPGWHGDWHAAPRRQYVVYIAGEIEAEVSDGEVRRFGPDSVTPAEDTVGKGHSSRVVRPGEALGVVVQLDG